MRLYFWWGCRRNLKLSTLGSERVKQLSPGRRCSGTMRLLLDSTACDSVSIGCPDSLLSQARLFFFAYDIYEFHCTLLKMPSSLLIIIIIGKNEFKLCPCLVVWQTREPFWRTRASSLANTKSPFSGAQPERMFNFLSYACMRRRKSHKKKVHIVVLVVGRRWGSHLHGVEWL